MGSALARRVDLILAWCPGTTPTCGCEVRTNTMESPCFLNHHRQHEDQFSESSPLLTKFASYFFRCLSGGDNPIAD